MTALTVRRILVFLLLLWVLILGGWGYLPLALVLAAGSELVLADPIHDDEE